MAMLRAGGTAVDAAIAIQAVLTLVEPQSSGIGGGAFLLHHDGQRGVTQAWDGRETAPAAARGDLFMQNGQPMPFAAAVVGGASLYGGEGRLAKTIAGVLIIVVLGNALNLMNVDSYWQRIAIGVVIVAAAAADRLRHARRD